MDEHGSMEHEKRDAAFWYMIATLCGVRAHGEGDDFVSTVLVVRSDRPTW